MTPERPTYRLTIRPEPDVELTEVHLRRALKSLLRTYRFRCLNIEVVEEDRDSQTTSKEPAE